MRRAVMFVLVLLCGSCAAAILIHAAQQADTTAYDIAFTSIGDGKVGIYRMRGDGTQSKPVIPDAGRMTILVPGSWSPDGARIGYFAYGRDDGELLKKYPVPMHLPLYVVNADGTGRERLLDVPVEPFPAWSPDSTRLAFSSGFEDPRLGAPAVLQGREPPSTAVYVADVRTRRVTRLTPFGQNRFVSWSPDGRRLVYSGTEAGAIKGDIYAVDINGMNLRKLLDCPDGAVSFAVSPLLRR